MKTPRPLASPYPIAMADHADIAEAEAAADRAELKDLRVRLRGKAQRLVGVIEALEDPETLADTWRTVRLVRQTDAMLVQLYADADQVLASIGRGPGHKASSRPPSTVPEDEESPEDEAAETMRQVNLIVVGRARHAGFWPNGEVFDDVTAMTEARLTPTVDYDLPAPRHNVDCLRFYILRRANASVHHQAQAQGHWSDGSPFDPGAADPGFYGVSVNGDEPRLNRGKDEDAPSGTPWWFVYNPAFKAPHTRAPP